MIKKIYNANKKGIALVEVLIGAAIISVGILAITSAYTTYVSYAFSNQYNTQISYMMEEALEAVSFFRDDSWAVNIAPLSTTTTYYLTFNGSSFSTTTTPQYVDDKFLRSITLSDVKRDANEDITSDGTYDPNIKLVTTSVSFSYKGATTTKSISMYITNLYDN